MHKKIVLCVFFVFAFIACTAEPVNTLGSNNGYDDINYASYPSEKKTGVVDTRYSEWKTIYYRTLEQEIALKQEEPSKIDAFKNAEYSQGSARILWQTDVNKTKECDGSAKDGSLCTVSEGIGYGMLITFFQGDKDAFEKLWKYSKYRQGATGTTYLMDWKLRSFVYVAVGAGSATDADLDVATALILGYKKWGDAEMLTNALQIASDIWKLEIRDGNKLLMPGNTPMWKNADSYNPSYFSPVALRLFAEYDTDHDWKSALDANYAWLENISAKGNLVPDWANSQGVPGAPPNGDGANTYSQYNKESVRVPWRLAWDYDWYNEARAKTILTRFADFITKQTNGNPSVICGGHAYPTASGTCGNAKGMKYDASLCAVGMASPDYNDWLNACNPRVVDVKITGFSYYDHILQMMYSQLLNGKYLKP